MNTNKKKVDFLGGGVMNSDVIMITLGGGIQRAVARATASINDNFDDSELTAAHC